MRYCQFEGAVERNNVKDETVKLRKMYISELLSDFKYSNSEGLYSVILTPPHTYI